ncbi:MAG TPA: hypothetical protein [Caudoviricetes sp.]|nr:MAG TPA: hypothetical protein [Caudoviricetes sp.]
MDLCFTPGLSFPSHVRGWAHVRPFLLLRG